jgi:pilus assembly protein CpaB
MRSRGFLMLFIAAIAGLAAVFLAARWMQNQGGEKGRIAVANADIELGGRISSRDDPHDRLARRQRAGGAFSEALQARGARRAGVDPARRAAHRNAARSPIGTKGGLSAVVPKASAR